MHCLKIGAIGKFTCNRQYSINVAHKHVFALPYSFTFTSKDISDSNNGNGSNYRKVTEFKKYILLLKIDLLFPETQWWELSNN